MALETFFSQPLAKLSDGGISRGIDVSVFYRSGGLDNKEVSVETKRIFTSC